MEKQPNDNSVLEEKPQKITLAVGITFCLLILGGFLFSFGEITSGEPDVVNPEETLIEEYKNSSYKIVTLVPNSFAKYANSEVLYVVATRGINDMGCGGRYDSGACYFFLESGYSQGPVAHYVGSWGAIAGAWGDSFKFKDNDTVVFMATGGDVGFSVSEVWELNVRTGSTTRISQEITESY